ncbi:MAG: hypothetical protein KDH15_01505 [Rhodocyclaceae bacterium]|nr:hypothetical protein [Rhodocyclaceae bacterium]
MDIKTSGFLPLRSARTFVVLLALAGCVTVQAQDAADTLPETKVLVSVTADGSVRVTDVDGKSLTPCVMREQYAYLKKYDPKFLERVSVCGKTSATEIKSISTLSVVRHSGSQCIEYGPVFHWGRLVMMQKCTD